MSMMEAVFEKQRKAFEKQVEEQNRGYRKPQKINIERNIQYGEDKLQTFDMIYQQMQNRIFRHHQYSWRRTCNG